MICYKDMTFCESACVNTSCRRHLNEQVWAAAEKWWGSKEAPVAVSDFSGDCPDFIEEKKQ